MRCNKTSPLTTKVIEKHFSKNVSLFNGSPIICSLVLLSMVANKNTNIGLVATTDDTSDTGPVFVAIRAKATAAGDKIKKTRKIK